MAPTAFTQHDLTIEGRLTRIETRLEGIESILKKQGEYRLAAFGSFVGAFLTFIVAIATL